MSTAAAPAPPVSGPVLFARYAYPPNRLGLCGPDDAPGLLAGAVEGADADLRAKALGFEGAYPYLRLIADENGLADPLDRRVVESYWLGGPLAAGVRPRAMHRDLDQRFRARMHTAEWRWLEAALDAGSRPIHAFHVLEVYPRAGLMRDPNATPMLDTIDACRIRWGRVSAVLDGRLVVAARRLTLVDGKLVLGPDQLEEATGWHGTGGLLDGVAPGDWVSLHWGWACDRLAPEQLVRLATWTDAAIASANRTV